MAIHPNKIDAQAMRKLVDNLTTAGVETGDVEVVATALAAGSARVSADIDHFLADTGDSRTRSYLAWADGTAEVGSIVGLETLNTAHGGSARDVLLRVRRNGLVAVEDRATSAVRGLGPALFEAMRQRDLELLDEVKANAPAIEGVTNAARAMAAAPKVRSAWGAITDAVTARSALAAAYRILRSVKAVTTSRDLDEARLAYRDPTVLAEIERGLDPVRRAIAEIEVGAGPGLYSVAEAEGGLAEDLASGYLIKDDGRRPDGGYRMATLPKGPRTHVSSVG
jgi:hypothetical protein